MALHIPPNLDINPYGCRWDPIDPHSCFDDSSCGCYISPCEEFSSKEQDCDWDTSDVCCTLVETC